jgi:hypothetical protein
MSSKDRELTLLETFRNLEPTDQEKLVAFASDLWSKERSQSRKTDLQRIKESLQGLPAFDAEEMQRIIEEGCEHIDPETW